MHNDFFESGLCIFNHNDTCINFSNGYIYVYKKYYMCILLVNKIEVKFIETKFCIFPAQIDSNIFWSILASTHNHTVHTK